MSIMTKKKSEKDRTADLVKLIFYHIVWTGAHSDTLCLFPVDWGRKRSTFFGNFLFPGKGYAGELSQNHSGRAISDLVLQFGKIKRGNNDSGNVYERNGSICIFQIPV